MSIPTDLVALNKNKCIFRTLDHTLLLEYTFVSVTVKQWAKRRKGLNKVNNCILNALVFLFYFTFSHFHCLNILGAFGLKKIGVSVCLYAIERRNY